MVQRTIEEIDADDRRDMYQLDRISYVAHNVDTELIVVPVQFSLLGVSSVCDGRLRWTYIYVSRRTCSRSVCSRLHDWPTTGSRLTSRSSVPSKRGGDRRSICSICLGASALSPSRTSHTSWVSPLTVSLSVVACGTSRRTCQRVQGDPVGVVHGDVWGATRDKRSGCLHHDVLMVQEQVRRALG
ncbi:hypothetical protein PIB30_002049 [Stylosanthes scabra]|uniref:Uncharacterized protein n=1 Tax=Stylosanthes scabra TaxID=79078 RepID=A0ABU6Q2S2_9FABA|nr:hypothetical protein [Stylosanthes scabra]